MKLPLLAPLLLTGCAMFSSPPGSQDPNTWIECTAPLARYEWQVVPLNELAPRCCTDKNRKWCEANRFIHGGACLIPLYGHPLGPTGLIISNMTEEEAARTPTLSSRGFHLFDCNNKPGTVRSHEVCHLRFVHEVTK